MDSSWFLERLDTSKLSLCVIRHVRRTAGGHGVRWLATISHTALVVLILSCSPSLSHLPFVPLYLSSAASRSLQPTSSASISPGYAFHMAFGWLLPFSRFLSIFLSLLIRRPSLYLSIVHNYTIRLLNRLMRPLLPALAAPFTETTTDEHESMSLSLSLYPFLSSSLSPPLFIPLPFISFRLLAKNTHRLCHSLLFCSCYLCFPCPPPCQPSRLIEISIFSGMRVCTSRGHPWWRTLQFPFFSVRC